MEEEVADTEESDHEDLPAKGELLVARRSLNLQPKPELQEQR